MGRRVDREIPSSHVRSAFVVIVILVLFDALMHTFFSHFHLLPVSRVPVVQSRFSLANYMYV